MCADKANKPTPPKQAHQGVSRGSNKSPLTYKYLTQYSQIIFRACLFTKGALSVGNTVAITKIIQLLKSFTFLGVFWVQFWGSVSKNSGLAWES